MVGKLHDAGFEYRRVRPIKEKFLDYGFRLDESEPSLVVAVGGDGTFLRAVRKYPESSILGIRSESRGNSLQIDFEDSDEAIKRILKGDYEISRVSKAELVYKDKKFWGLNEVYFIRDTSKFPGANRFRVFKEGKDVYSDEIYADGCMFATYFGSSAYNWSCQGPVLDEGEFAFTPIAGCCLNRKVKNVSEKAKSLVVKGDKINVKIKRSAENVICGDNQILVKTTLRKNEEISFRKSDSCIKLLKL